MRVAREIAVARVRQLPLGVPAALEGRGEEDAMRGRGIAQKGWRPQEHAVDDGEHRGVRADAEAERNNHARGEPGCGAQTAERVSRVLQDGLEQCGAAPISARFLGAVDAAECDICAAHGLGAGEAGALELVRLAIEVKAQLVVEVPFQRRSANECPDAVFEIAQKLGQHLLLSFYKSFDGYDSPCRSARGGMGRRLRADGVDVGLRHGYQMVPLWDSAGLDARAANGNQRPAF